MLFYPFTRQSRLIATPRKKAFKNIVEKGENDSNSIFAFPLIVFVHFPIKFSVFRRIKFFICKWFEFGQA